MDYEKKYKEALERARTLLTNEVAYDIFPELKESEDEKIRKELIQFFSDKDEEDYEGLHPRAQIVAWIEKQGEHTRFIEAIQVGDQVTKNEDGVLVNLSQLKRVAKKDEKQGEQKPYKTFDSSKLKPDSNPYWTMAPEYQLANCQKAAWSEKDEHMFNTIANSLNREKVERVWNTTEGEVDNWLKSLKERVQPQPKQEWSEEDENNILFLTSIIEECFKDKEKITLHSDTVCAHFTKEDVIDRLKSLRHQNTWKPDELQLECLSDAISDYNKRGYEAPILKELLEQLKKLREK